MSQLLEAQYEAEKRLLSAMWIAKDLAADKLREPLSIVGMGDFADDDCREFFQGMADLHERDGPINETSLYNAIEGRLSDRDRYVVLLAEIMDLEPHEVHMLYHAQQVHEFATRRRLIVKLQDTAGMVSDMSRDLSDVDLDFAGYQHFLSNRGAGGVDMKTLGDVTAKPSQWLWKPYIPLGNLTLMAGQPGIGKTWSLMDFSARVAMGWPWPDGCPGGDGGEAVFLSAEDDEETIAWRFEQLGCDRTKIHVMDKGVSEFVNGKQEYRFLDLSRDLHHVEAFLERRPAVRMLILDTAADFMGDANPNSNNEVRAVYGPVARMAKRRNIAVVLISHFNKKTDNTQAIYRGMGSLAFIALARVSWGFFPDPEDKSRVIMAPIKNNLGPMADAMAFSIIDNKPAWEPNPIDADADSLMQPPKLQTIKAGDKAKKWLRDQLQDGPVGATDLEESLPDGFSWRTVERVSNKIGVHKAKDGLHEGKWYWSLNGTLSETANTL
jgi:AAA domain/DnaB-like helicase N terminal domain